MEYDALIDVAMQMIVHAGDARKEIKKALDAGMAGQTAQAQEYMDSAKDALAQAHHCQTETIQQEASGERCVYSMLFTHAQDTLMTIYSEYYLAEKMLLMHDALDEKIRSLEERLCKN